jgi:hypothetical protein
VGAADPTSENLVAPDPAVLCELHGRLLAGDRVASDELAKKVLGPLVKRLERRWRRWSHTDRLYDAAVDAFLEYVDAPERYLDSGVHHLAEARAYRWEFRRAIPLQVVTLARSPS